MTPPRLASRDAQSVVQEKTLAEPGYSRHVLPLEYALPAASSVIAKEFVLQAVPNPS
jgi:hypothetical protein